MQATNYIYNNYINDRGSSHVLLEMCLKTTLHYPVVLQLINVGINTELLLVLLLLLLLLLS